MAPEDITEKDISLVGKFMNPNPACEYRGERQKIILSADHVYIVLADKFQWYVNIDTRPIAQFNAFLEDIN